MNIRTLILLNSLVCFIGCGHDITAMGPIAPVEISDNQYIDSWTHSYLSGQNVFIEQLQIQDDNTASYVVRSGTVVFQSGDGRWTQNSDTLTIQFSNCHEHTADPDLSETGCSHLNQKASKYYWDGVTISSQSFVSKEWTRKERGTLVKFFENKFLSLFKAVDVLI
ncbi:MAG: hypothetical protein OCD76_09565 [Reichenbachiella sp.]